MSSASKLLQVTVLYHEVSTSALLCIADIQLASKIKEPDQQGLKIPRMKSAYRMVVSAKSPQRFCHVVRYPESPNLRRT